MRASFCPSAHPVLPAKLQVLNQLPYRCQERQRHHQQGSQAEKGIRAETSPAEVADVVADHAAVDPAQAHVLADEVAGVNRAGNGPPPVG